MRRFIVFNKQEKMLRTGSCMDNNFLLQANKNEFVMEGKANDRTQKVKFDGPDDEGQPINPRVVDKTPEEIEEDNPTPPEIPFEKQPAPITNEQLQGILDRLNDLEKVG